MSQQNCNCNCECVVPVDIPLLGLALRVDGSGLAGKPGTGCEIPDLRFDRETKLNYRYMGKQVYARLVDFGPLPNNTQKSVPHNIPDIEWVHVDNSFSHVTRPINGIGAGSLGRGHPDPARSWYYGVNPSTMNITTGMDRSDHSAVFCVIYTKTTDPVVNP